MSDQAQRPKRQQLLRSFYERRLGCLLILASVMAGASGCATEPEDTPAGAAYYKLFDCDQLAQHGRDVSLTAAELAGLGRHHCVAAPNNVVIFWPAAFERSSGGAQDDALLKLRNEFQAVQQASLEKNCSIQFQPRSTPNSQATC
jgi:hypothetical protein